MKLLNMILCIAFFAVLLAPFVIVTAKLSGRSLVANSRELATSARLAANAVAHKGHAEVFGSYNENAPTGSIMAANDANFDAAHLSEPLTEFIVDTPDDEGLDVMLEALAPSVPVGRSFGYRVHDTKEAFQAALNNEDIREIGGDFGHVRKTGTQADGRTDNKGLVMVLDNDQGGEEPAVQQRAVVNLRNRLLRSELYRLEALLEANDTALTPNWGVTNTAADPDGNLLSDIDLGGDARGINSNTVLYGGSAWITRFLSLGIGSNAARHQTRNLTPEQLAGLLRVARLVVSDFRYQSSATAKEKIVKDKVYSYYSKAGAMPDDPSNIKRFITPVPGGGMLRVYITSVRKRTEVCVEHYSRLILTSSLGIRKTAPTFT